MVNENEHICSVTYYRLKKLSVVIVNYNVCYFLEQALVSVFKALEKVDGEVWVVDNNSADNSVAMVRRRFPQVRLIRNEENVGFSRANNQAIRQASGEYILLLNPDTVVAEDTFTRCLAFMDQNPEAGGLGVKMLDGNGRFLPESKRGLPTPWVSLCRILGLSALFPQSKIFNRYYLGFLDPEQVQEVDVLAGAFMLLRRGSLDKTGLLDENFFMYGEDIDLSYRLQQAGYRNYYFPHTRIIHYKGESTKRGSLNYVYLFYRAMAVFVRKHFAGGQAALFSILIHAAILLRAGMSATARFLRQAFPFLLDAGLIYTGMLGLKSFWEKTYKHEPGNFPDTFMEVAVPAYISIWVGTSWLLGAYDQPRSFRRLVRGIFFGTLLISALSNFLDQYRFSKALILLGAGESLILIRFRQYLSDRLTFSGASPKAGRRKKIAVAGAYPEYQRVAQLLAAARVPADLVGYLSPAPGPDPGQDYLGDLQQVNQLTRMHAIDELIFCGRDLSAAQIITWMVRLNNQDLHYKILPEGSEYIIGSSSRTGPGDYYALEISLNLFLPVYRRQKRLLDILLSLGLLLTFPLVLAWVENKKNCWRNCWRVLLGKNSWVGLRYTRPTGQALPGVLSPADDYVGMAPDVTVCEKLEVLYAKEYTLSRDLYLMQRLFRHLGN